MGSRRKENDYKRIENMRKVLLTSDVLNDNDHIYILSLDNIFDLFKFRIINDDLIEAFIAASAKLKENGIECKVAIIPFVVYNNACVDFEGRPELGILNPLDELKHIGIDINCKVMIPDFLKDKAKAL